MKTLRIFLLIIVLLLLTFIFMVDLAATGRQTDGNFGHNLNGSGGIPQAFTESNKSQAIDPVGRLEWLISS